MQVRDIRGPLEPRFVWKPGLNLGRILNNRDIDLIL